MRVTRLVLHSLAATLALGAAALPLHAQGGARAARAAAAGEGAQGAQSATFRPGDPVLVTWPPATVAYPGTVDRVGTDGRYFIRFSGAIAPSDQWVEGRLIRPAANGAPTATAPKGGAWRVGEVVEVDWKGTWYRATVLEGSGARAKVRYDGYDASWDEWVSEPRIRRPASPAPAAPVTPLGRYECTTFDAGQLNVVGEFVLSANGRYQDLIHRQGGTWTLDERTGRIRFLTGPQRTDADVKYEERSPRGKPWVVFTYRSGAQLHCHRAG